MNPKAANFSKKHDNQFSVSLFNFNKCCIWAKVIRRCFTLERLLLDCKVRLAMTNDVGTSTEVCRDKIRMAAKNVAEVEKILISLMTMRGPLSPNQGWRFISVKRMYVEVKKEVKTWSSKLFGTDYLSLSSFGQIYEHIE